MYHIIVTLARNKFLSRVIKFHWFLLARATNGRGGGKVGGELSLLKRSTHMWQCHSLWGERKHGFSRTTYISFFFFLFSKGGWGVWEGGRRQKSPQPFLIFFIDFFFLHTHIRWLDVVLVSCMYICTYVPIYLCMYVSIVLYMLSIILFNCAYITN